MERHPFFGNIPFKFYEEKKVCLFSFSKVSAKNIALFKIPPLFKPELDSDIDTRYFDTEFTNEPVCVTPPGNNSKTFFFYSDLNSSFVFRFVSGSTESINALGMSDDAFERFPIFL